MDVTVKNLPTALVFGAYNGSSCHVVEEFHSRTFGTSLRVRAADGREFTVSPGQYDVSEESATVFQSACEAVPAPFIGPGLRRIQRYSARCTT